MAFAGDITFNPQVDFLKTPSGQQFKFTFPKGEELPSKGFDAGNDTYLAPLQDGSTVEVAIGNNSDRLQRISPFSEWNGKDFEDCTILVKVKGKCTTDHISPAGPWLKYKGTTNSQSPTQSKSTKFRSFGKHQ